ncbi:MAG: hypothetical protein AB7P33_15115 [Dehalococcoidia bacterium]
MYNENARGEQIAGDVMAPIEVAWLVKAGIAGITAGALMAMFAMVLAALDGLGLWAPPRAITAVFFGEDNLGGSLVLADVAVGIGIHMVLSMAFGVMFALGIGLAAAYLTPSVEVLLGAIWALVLWAVNTYAIADIFNGGELFTQAMPDWVWILSHAIYGMTLGLVYAWWRHGTTAVTEKQL